jgi:ribonuclease HI
MNSPLLAAHPIPLEKSETALGGAASRGDSEESRGRQDINAGPRASQGGARNGRVDMAVISTDGAYWSHVRCGAWAAVIRDGMFSRELSGFERETTSNRMELRAVLEALRSIQTPRTVLIRTDSTYTKNVCESWCWRWERNRWLLLGKGQPQAVKNRAIIEDIMALLRRHDVEFELVKGHSGDPDNERADALAAAALRNARREKGGV